MSIKYNAASAHHTVEPLNGDAIRGYLPQDIKANIEVFQQLESTNRYLMQRVQQQPKEAQVCLAEAQTQGRGRRGRHWVTPTGNALTLSVLQLVNRPAEELMGLSLAIGVGIIEALQVHSVDGVQLKWPNDLVIDSKKVGGILIEIAKAQSGGTYVVIGLGLNIAVVAEDSRMQDVEQPWTDLNSISNMQQLPRNQIAAAIITSMLQTTLHFERDGFVAFKDRYHALDSLYKKTIQLEGSQNMIGAAVGVNADGNLLVLCENSGEVHSVNSGEVSVRPHRVSSETIN